MQIDDFLNFYDYGSNFIKVKFIINTKGGVHGYYEDMIDGDQWQSYLSNGVYLLVINKEIVYVGRSNCLRDRLRLHRSKLKVDEFYVWDLGKDNSYEKSVMEEQFAIEYCNPVLNNSYYIDYENTYSGEPQSLDFVKGYIKLIENIKLNNNKKNIKRLITKYIK